MPRLVPFSYAVFFLAALALPVVAPAQVTIPPEDEKRAEANVFMNAKMIAIDRQRDRIEVRDNDGVRRTFVLDDDATLPAGRIRAGTEVILAVKASGGQSRVVSVRASEPAPAARIPQSSAEPVFIPAPDVRFRSSADQVAFQSGTVAAGANPSAPVPPGVPFVMGSSGFIDPATGVFVPNTVPAAVGNVAAGNISSANTAGGAAVVNGAALPGTVAGSGGILSQGSAVNGTTVQTGVDFSPPNLSGLESTQRTLTAPVQGTTTRTQVPQSTGRIVNEPVPTNVTSTLGGPGTPAVVDPVTGQLVAAGTGTPLIDAPPGTTMVVTDPVTGLQTTVPASTVVGPTTSRRLSAPSARVAGAANVNGTVGGTGSTTTRRSGVNTTPGTTNINTTATAGVPPVTGTAVINGQRVTRLPPPSGATAGTGTQTGAVVPRTGTTTGTIGTIGTTGTAGTTGMTSPTGVGGVSGSTGVTGAGTSGVGGFTGVTGVPTTAGATFVPSGTFVTTPGVTTPFATGIGVGGARPAVRSFTNADLASISRAAGTTGVSTVATTGPGVTPNQGAATANVLSDTGVVGVPGSFAPTGPVSTQIGGARAAPTLDTVQPSPDLGGLGADAAPLPVPRAVQAFEASMARLAARTEEVDAAFARYRDSCLGYPSIFGLQQRSWMGLWDGQSTPTETNDSCEPMLAYAIRLGEQVQRGVRTAEDQARRSGVLPGIRRQIRAQYGMDWDGWDH